MDRTDGTDLEKHRGMGLEPTIVIRQPHPLDRTPTPEDPPPVPIFDTLKVATNLESSGLSRETASAIADGIRQAFDSHHDTLVTREYLLTIALGIVTANAAITFGLLKLLLP